ncbi:MAG: TPM domain-containing protein [Polymorphobacter sp.]|uniref:TPM domain-containing protein n=1 Tax=Polymorphobacter sp. TaxID=1909290 RepID=UPI003A85E541
MARGSPEDERTEDRLGRLIMLLLVVLALVTTIVGLAREARAQPAFPPLEGRVTDAAQILPGDVAAQIEAALKELEDTTGTQLVIATVPSLQGYEIEDYGYQLGRAWGIGQKDDDNGAILLVAPNERKVRIEVGYGLEGVLTDAMTSQIIRRQIIPRFKAGDMAGGVVAGTGEMIRLLQLPPEEAAAAALAARDRQRAQDEPDPIAVIFWIAIIVLWIFFSVARGNRGRRRGSAIIWGSGMGGGWGGGGGFGGGGGYGGGSFGGGGGSFGGGGSSGSW